MSEFQLLYRGQRAIFSREEVRDHATKLDISKRWLEDTCGRNGRHTIRLPCNLAHYIILATEDGPVPPYEEAKLRLITAACLLDATPDVLARWLTLCPLKDRKMMHLIIFLLDNQKMNSLLKLCDIMCFRSESILRMHQATSRKEFKFRLYRYIYQKSRGKI